MITSSRKLAGSVLERFGVWIWRLYYYETDLHDHSSPTLPGIDVQIRRVPPDELSERRDELGDFGRRSRGYALARGDRCYFAECSGRLAGYSWVNFHGVSVGPYLLSPLDEQGVYSHSGFVFPEFRGKRLFQHMLAHVYRELREEGYRFACNMVARDNAASIRTREKFRVVGKRILVVRLPRREPWLVGGPIGTGALLKSVGESTQPVIRGEPPMSALPCRSKILVTCRSARATGDV